MARKISIVLTGGLGNQLFQIAAALNIAKQDPILVDCTLGRARTNASLEPEVFSFKLPIQIRRLDIRKSSNFETKVFGFLLRNGLEKSRLEEISGVFTLIKVLGSTVLSLRYLRPVWARVNSGVGFDKETNIKGNLLIGYFQTYKNFEVSYVKMAMKDMSPVVINPILAGYQHLASTSNPLVVHYRLGDYKDEKNFGIPDQSYYSKAIADQWQSGKYESIWVFSDEINEVKAMFPSEFLPHVHWVEELDDDPATALEVMRLGKGYVIANSTYSWWGAQLSYTEAPDVIAPQPWFRGAPEPNELIPPAWRRIAGWNGQ